MFLEISTAGHLEQIAVLNWYSYNFLISVYYYGGYFSFAREKYGIYLWYKPWFSEYSASISLLCRSLEALLWVLLIPLSVYHWCCCLPLFNSTYMYIVCMHLSPSSSFLQRSVVLDSCCADGQVSLCNTTCHLWRSVYLHVYHTGRSGLGLYQSLDIDRPSSGTLPTSNSQSQRIPAFWDSGATVHICVRAWCQNISAYFTQLITSYKRTFNCI